MMHRCNRTKIMRRMKMKTKNNPYFAIETSEEELTADIYIFGDIASKRGGLNKLLAPSSDQSSYDLAQRVANIPEDYAIVVHINSNGGELKEGLGIYNVLKVKKHFHGVVETRDIKNPAMSVWGFLFMKTDKAHRAEGLRN